MTTEGEQYERSDGTEIEVVARAQQDHERRCWVEFRFPDGTTERGHMSPEKIMQQVSDENWHPLDSGPCRV